MAILNNSTNLLSFKQAKITIPAGETVTYQNPYNFVRILDSTGTDQDLLYRFGASSIETFLTVGLGLRFQDTLASLTIRNVTTAAVTVTIAEIQGDIYDDRLTITGTVETQSKPFTTATVTLETFDANGEIACDSSGYKNVLIQNMSATDPIYVFGANTYEVAPNGTFEKDFAGTFTIYGTAGQTASVGYFS